MNKGSKCTKPTFFLAYEEVEFVHTGIYNKDLINCYGGAGFLGLLYDSQNGSIISGLPETITISSTNGACVAYSRTQDALVSIDCMELAWTMCTKDCENICEWTLVLTVVWIRPNA